MSDDTEPQAPSTTLPSDVARRKKGSGRRSAQRAQVVGRWLRHILYGMGWHGLLARLFLAGITIPTAFAGTPTERLLLPIESLGEDGTVVSNTVALQDL